MITIPTRSRRAPPLGLPCRMSTGLQARQHAGAVHPDHGQLGAQEEHAKGQDPQHASCDQGGRAHSPTAIREGAPPRPFDARKTAGPWDPPARDAPPGASPAVS
jgi:hypothetical protein